MTEEKENESELGNGEGYPSIPPSKRRTGEEATPQRHAPHIPSSVHWILRGPQLAEGCPSFFNHRFFHIAPDAELPSPSPDNETQRVKWPLHVRQPASRAVFAPILNNIGYLRHALSRALCSPNTPSPHLPAEPTAAGSSELERWGTTPALPKAGRLGWTTSLAQWSPPCRPSQNDKWCPRWAAGWHVGCDDDEHSQNNDVAAREGPVASWLRGRDRGDRGSPHRSPHQATP